MSLRDASAAHSRSASSLAGAAAAAAPYGHSHSGGSARPFHPDTLALLQPHVETTTLVELVQRINEEEHIPVADRPRRWMDGEETEETTGSAAPLADASDSDRVNVHAQLECRRIALRCVAHWAGKPAGFVTAPATPTNAGASAAAPSAAAAAPSSLPDESLVSLFPAVCASLDVYTREAARSQLWLPLLAANVDAANAMIERTLQLIQSSGASGGAQPPVKSVPSPAAPVPTTPSVLTAAQCEELSNCVVQLIGNMHRCMVWGTPLALQPQLATAATAPAAAVAAAATAASSVTSGPVAIPAASGKMQRSGSKDALTPRSVIAPPSLSPPQHQPGALDPSGAAGGRFISSTSSLFSPSASSTLLNADWLQLQSRFPLTDGTEQSDSTGATTPRIGFGAAAAATESEGDAERYQSRVHGLRPTRPSAVTSALAGRHCLPAAASAAAASPFAALSLSSESHSSRSAAHAHVHAPRDFRASAAEKVRVHALQCVHTVARLAPKLFHQHWSPFIPTDVAAALSRGPARAGREASLVTVLLHDPAYKVRALAAQCLAASIVDSPLTRWTGAMADSKGAAGAGAGAARIRKNREGGEMKSVGAFTSLSVRLADTMRALHAGLMESLRSESQASVLQNVLKCLAVLVQNTPYQTLARTASASASASAAPAGGAAAQLDANSSSGGGMLVPIVVHLLTHMLHEPSSYAVSAAAAAAAVAPAQPVPAASKPGSRSGAGTWRSSAFPPASPSPSPASPAPRASVTSAAVAAVQAQQQAAKADLRHAIFSCLAAIFDTASALPEMRALLVPSASSSPASSSPAAASPFHVDVVALLISHARYRRPTDPTPDAMTLLAKLARQVPQSLAPYWRWNSKMGAHSLSGLIRDCLAATPLPPSAHNGARPSTTHSSHISSPVPPDVQTKLLALKILEEWTKQDSVGGTGSSGGGGGEGDDEEEKEGGSYEPLEHESGFFSLEGSLELFGVELVRLYLSLSPSGGAAGTGHALAPSPAELHAQKQGAIATGNVRAKVLIALSLLPYTRWGRLTPTQRLTIRTMALRAAGEEVTSMRAAACRCLCLLALYAAREVTQDDIAAAASAAAEGEAGAALDSDASAAAAATPLSFVRHATATLLRLVDPSSSPVIAVRIKAAWSLANIADFGWHGTLQHGQGGGGGGGGAGVSIVSGPSCPPAHDLLPAPLYLALIERLLRSTGDNEKVVSNSVRAVGNLARWYPLPAQGTCAPAVPGATADLFLRMHSTLVSALSAARSHKSRWNSCHALGNAFRNAGMPALLRGRADADSAARDTFAALVDVMRDVQPTVAAGGSGAPNLKGKGGGGGGESSKHSNFKVRIHAAAALSAPPSRAHYGSAFATVLAALLAVSAPLVSGSGGGDGAASLQLTPASGSSSAGAAAVESTFKDYKYLAQLRLQILHSLCAVLCLFDGARQEEQAAGAGASAADSDGELLQLYLSHSHVLARLILSERLRWEKESKLLARVERATAAAATATTAGSAAGAGAKGRMKAAGARGVVQPGAAAAASALPKATIDEAQRLVERAASSIESVMRVIESSDGQHGGLAARFAAEANGETPNTPSGSSEPHAPLVSPPRMAL